MKIKHYVVTYNNPIWIKCVESIISCSTTHERTITVVNNHPNFKMPDHLSSYVRVIHNQSRASFSTGHLSRNWNEALIDGFRDLKAPDADLVVLCQNDTEFEPDYVERLVRLHMRFDLVTHGAGDNCVSYTAQAIKRVGLWDERFCNIGYQEADYFLRAAKWLDARASINDRRHKRVFNPSSDIITLQNVTGHDRDDAAHHESMKYHAVSYHMLQSKWGASAWLEGPTPVNPSPRIDSYVLYPYFEKDITTLRDQRYLVPKGF